MIQSYVYSYVTSNSVDDPFTNRRAGRKWFTGFMKRHPDLSVRKAQSMNPARAAQLNRFIVTDYFTKLDTTLEQLNLLTRPDRIYDMDEKGCRLTLHHQQKVVSAKGRKRVHVVAPEHAENVTIVACANAVGNCVPPMIIFKGVNRKPSFGDDLPPLATVEMAPKGSMTNAVFIKWLHHLGKFKQAGPVLLIFDGAKCHLHPDIVDVADIYEIQLFCLPSNTTHELQPLDKSVFRSFEHYWDEEVLNFWRHRPDRQISKDVFGKLFTPVWSKAMRMDNVISGSRATGIHPFNKDIIPEHAFAPQQAVVFMLSHPRPRLMLSHPQPRLMLSHPQP